LASGQYKNEVKFFRYFLSKGISKLEYKPTTNLTTEIKKAPLRIVERLSGDPAGIRTQDPNIKSVMLYQLSYGII
jgi:hypothetical protein